MDERNTWPGWQCVRQLGAGSFGKVYEIEREEFGKTYSAALKVITIPPSPVEVQNAYSEGMDEQSVTAYFHGFVESIVSEFALMSDLKGHTNIVSYEDHMVVKHEDGIGWDILIRMELLTPLQKWNEAHPLREDDVIRLGCDICRALELCQRKNIIHRDIKPENIFVNEYGNYKLGDFGIARTVEKTMSSLSQKGTYAYIAPEVYHGQPYGVTADIYSLGIVLYRYLNGNRIPFLPLGAIRYSDREEAFEKRMRGEPVPLPIDGSSRLKEVVLRAISYEPEERFQSAAEFYQALEACIQQPEETDERTLLLFQTEPEESPKQMQTPPNPVLRMPDIGEMEQIDKKDGSRIKAPAIVGIALAAIVVVVCVVVFAILRKTGYDGALNQINAGVGMSESERDSDIRENEDTYTDNGSGEAGTETASDDREEDNEKGEEDSEQPMMFRKVIEFEKNKEWNEKHIVGTAYVPDEEEMEMINAAVDYTNWDDYLEARYASYALAEPASEVGLLSQTENFRLYERNEDRMMLIETPDHSYLLAEVRPVSGIRVEPPVIAEADYDQDGENELAIRVYLLYGTGLSVDSLFMADKASDGQWYLFQFMYEEYSETISEKCDRIKIEDQYYFKLEDRTIAVPQTVLEYNSFLGYTVGSLVHVECSPEGILLKEEIGSVLKGAPDCNYSLGNGISAAVIYHGDGEWELEDFDYYNARLEDYVKGVFCCYRTGDVEKAATEYKIIFEALKNPATDCEVTKVSYNSDELGYDEFRVDIECTVDGGKTIDLWSLNVQQNDLDATGITDLYDIHSYDLWTIR